MKTGYFLIFLSSFCLQGGQHEIFIKYYKEVYYQFTEPTVNGYNHHIRQIPDDNRTITDKYADYADWHAGNSIIE